MVWLQWSFVCHLPKQNHYLAFYSQPKVWEHSLAKIITIAAKVTMYMAKRMKSLYIFTKAMFVICYN